MLQSHKYYTEAINELLYMLNTGEAHKYNISTISQTQKGDKKLSIYLNINHRQNYMGFSQQEYRCWEKLKAEGEKSNRG